MICSNLNDRFTVSSENGNGKLTYPVALLTADEIMFAGEKIGTSNNNNYLNTELYWWTLSPSYFIDYFASVFTLGSSGDLHNGSEGNAQHGVRTVVSIQSRIKIDCGDGTTANPYVILTN